MQAETTASILGAENGEEEVLERKHPAHHHAPDCALPDQGDSALPAEKLSREALALFPALKRVLDWKDLSSVQVNEVTHDYDFSDRIEDMLYKAWPLPYPPYLYHRMSIGPAQMQMQQIDELKQKYSQQLRAVDPLTAGGAQRLIGAYLTRELERLDKRQYASDAPASPRQGDDLSTQKRFERLQARWDDARKTHDTPTLRSLLLESYNVGSGRSQVDRIDAIKSQLDEYLPKCSF